MSCVPGVTTLKYGASAGRENSWPGFFGIRWISKLKKPRSRITAGTHAGTRPRSSPQMSMFVTRLSAGNFCIASRIQKSSCRRKK